jgi:DNA-binding IclR family transcriptional regulator
MTAGYQGNGIKSLESALAVLNYLTSHKGAVSLSDLARGCDMSPSNVHRYMATFIQAGLVRQEGRSGRYDLGLGAMELGLAAIGRHDFVNNAADGLGQLSSETGMTVLLSVWGNDGATVVRWERGATPTVTSIGLGTTLPLLHSATGRAFLAWGPPTAIAAARESELRRATRNPALLLDVAPTKAGLNDLVAGIRDSGFASVDGRYIPGLVAAAAPILDWQNEAQAVITLVGTDPGAIGRNSAQIQALKHFCAERSVRDRS